MTVIQIEYQPERLVGTALVAEDGSVWIAVVPRWWDIATRLWWWLTPSHRKAWVTLSTKEGKIRAKAVLIALQNVRIGSPPSAKKETSYGS